MITTAPEFTGHWDQLLFRDYLVNHPETATEYAKLKLRLASEYGSDRVGYTAAKSDFIAHVIEKALSRREAHSR